MNRIYKLIKKYGLFKGPFFAIRWIYCKKIRKQQAARISGMKSSIFKIKGFNDFERYYKGEIQEEIKQIIKGERKILFYDRDDVNKENDIKTRWELNRMHHLPVLAMKSSDPDAYKQIIIDLQESNLDSVLEDTNAMEVSISAINIIATCQLMNAEKVTYSEVVLQHFIKKSLCYIIENIEKGILYSNNHYFFNLIGILWITENIQKNKQIELLNRNTYKRLESLLDQIINKDGSLYEGSTRYHKYVLESLLSFILFNNKSQQKNEIINYAKAMYSFCCYASFNNSVISIGDNDSGRIFGLPEYFEYDSLDITLIHKIAKKLGFEAFIQKGEKRILNINMSEKPSFGLFKLENKSWQVAVRCDQSRDMLVRKFITIHYHNDQLSITVIYKNAYLFIDLGTYTYVRNNNLRAQSLKTSSHNTLTIECEEQNVIHHSGNIVERHIIGKVSNYSKKLFQGEFINYNGISHTRKLLINDSLIVQDTISNTKSLINKTIKLYYHLHPDVKPSIMNNRFMFEINGIILTMKSNDNVKLSIETSQYSPEYGEKRLTEVAVITYNIKENQRSVTIISEIKQLNKNRNE